MTNLTTQKWENRQQSNVRLCAGQLIYISYDHRCKLWQYLSFTSTGHILHIVITIAGYHRLPAGSPCLNYPDFPREMRGTNLRRFSAGTCSSALLTCFLVAVFAFHAQAANEHDTKTEAVPRGGGRQLLSAITICDTKPAFVELKPTTSPYRTKHEVPSNVDIDIFAYATDQRCYKCVDYRSVFGSASFFLCDHVSFPSVITHTSMA